VVGYARAEGAQAVDGAGDAVEGDAFQAGFADQFGGGERGEGRGEGGCERVEGEERGGGVEGECCGGLFGVRVSG
jgi:hypothetical protein